MGYGGNAFDIIVFLIKWILLCSALPIAFVVGILWIIRTLKKNKKTDTRGALDTEPVYCLKCGAAIGIKQQACQVCGWTWQ